MFKLTIFSIQFTQPNTLHIDFATERIIIIIIAMLSFFSFQFSVNFSFLSRFKSFLMHSCSMHASMTHDAQPFLILVILQKIVGEIRLLLPFANRKYSYNFINGKWKLSFFWVSQHNLPYSSDYICMHYAFIL